MKEKYLLVFSGYNQRAVIAFLRTLVQCNVDNYLIVASSNEDAIFGTKYYNKVIYTRKNKELSVTLFQEIIKKVEKENNNAEFVIAPSTEGLNRFLLDNLEDLKKINCIVPLVKKELYCTISDKESFSKVCNNFELDIPPSIRIEECFSTPFVAKPKKYYSEKGKETFSPVLVTNEIEFDKFYKTYNKNDFFYQEYIWGESYYLLYYITQTGRIYKFSQKNLAQQPDGKSIIAAVPSIIHEENISLRYENMLLDLHYYGFIMIELRKRKDKFYMIEANPRFWGPSQLFCDAGMNLFEIFLLEYGFINNEFIHTKNICEDTRYLWYDGIQQIKDAGKDIVVYDETLEHTWFDDSGWKKWDIYHREDTIKISMMNTSKFKR